MKKKLLECLDKHVDLEGAEAVVVEEILGQEIAPERRSYDSGSFAGFVLPVSASQFCSSVVCSFQRFGPMRIAQSDPKEHTAQQIELDDSDMDKICALWIRYRIEMIKKG